MKAASSLEAAFFLRENQDPTCRKIMAQKRIAVFVSPHGFGHAARASAILRSLSESTICSEIHLYTTVPRWFFRLPGAPPIVYHHILTDIGMVQRTPFEEDLEATLKALGDFLPFNDALLHDLVEQMISSKIDVIVTDISPLAIVVADRSGRRCILIENFTWDWIYQGYAAQWPELVPYIDTFSALYSKVDLRIQTQPYCLGVPGSLVVPPISRRPSQRISEIRRQLDLPEGRPLVVVTLGGSHQQQDFIDRLEAAEDLCFVVPGAAKRTLCRKNIRLLPFESRLCHPSLMCAADVVVGKLGYSTLAEVYRSRTPFAFIPRPEFPESPILERFVHRHLPHTRIPLDRFRSCEWIPRVQELAALPKAPFETKGTEPATTVAEHILALA
ncbi:MAG: hypothetical protein P8Y44_04270 [Acidobacteriota bacterium]